MSSSSRPSRRNSDGPEHVKRGSRERPRIVHFTDELKLRVGAQGIEKSRDEEPWIERPTKE